MLADTLADAEILAATLADDGSLVDVIDPATDLVRAAHELYVWLRAADERGLDVLIAGLPPPIGLGHAIRDRLVKAAGLG